MFYNVGSNARTTRVAVGKVPTKAYRCWYAMLYRCYSGKKPEYVGCTVCEEWLDFDNFRPWFDNTHTDDWELDKDLLGTGKLYSPATCVFVPKWLNQLLTFPKKPRNLPTGVYKGRTPGTFRAEIKLAGVPTNLGVFPCPDTAYAAWKQAKLEYINSSKPELDAIDPRLHPAILAKL